MSEEDDIRRKEIDENDRRTVQAMNDAIREAKNELAKDAVPHMIGHYLVRVVRNGPLVPARIYLGCMCTINGSDENTLHEWKLSCDRSPTTLGEICGEQCEAWQVIRKTGLRAISKEEYELILAQREWDVAHNPETVTASKVDFNKLAIPKF